LSREWESKRGLQNLDDVAGSATAPNEPDHEPDQLSMAMRDKLAAQQPCGLLPHRGRTRTKKRVVDFARDANRKAPPCTTSTAEPTQRHFRTISTEGAKTVSPPCLVPTPESSQSRDCSFRTPKDGESGDGHQEVKKGVHSPGGDGIGSYPHPLCQQKGTDIQPGILEPDT